MKPRVNLSQVMQRAWLTSTHLVRALAGSGGSSNRVASGPAAWVPNIIPANARRQEDGTLRYTEDGTLRVMES